MKKQLQAWRVPLGVGAVHIVLIILIASLRDNQTQTRRPAGIRVALAALPQAAQPTKSPSSNQPTNVQKATQKRPPIKTVTSSHRKVSAAPRKPKKKKWRARTPDEIRKGLTVKQVSKVTPRRVSRPRRTANLSNLQNLVSDFAKVAHATSMIGEPIAISADYMAKVQAIIYRTWKQPTRAEVPTANQSVGIRLEIKRSGAIAKSCITQRSKSLVMNQSVKALLNALDTLPPLNDDYPDKQLRLDIVLRLQ